MNKTKSITSAALASVVFLTSCASERIADYQPSVCPPTERAVQQSGVEVALDSFVETERTKQYFNLDAVAEGIAILHVRVVNKTADRTFLVEKKNFQLFLSGAVEGLTGNGKKIERSSGAGETLNAIGGPGLIGIAGASMVSQAMEIQRNFAGKELGDQTLSPGQSMEGFVYYSPTPKGANWSQSATVKIYLTETKTRHTIEINVPLSR
jgi:hypothetical protein